MSVVHHRARTRLLLQRRRVNQFEPKREPRELKEERVTGEFMLRHNELLSSPLRLRYFRETHRAGDDEGWGERRERREGSWRCAPLHRGGGGGGWGGGGLCELSHSLAVVLGRGHLVVAGAEQRGQVLHQVPAITHSTGAYRGNDFIVWKTCMHPCMYACIHVCMHACIHTCRAYMHIRAYIHT